MIEIGDDAGPQPRWLDCISEAIRIRVTVGDYVGGVGTTQGEVAFAQRSDWLVRPAVATRALATPPARTG
jgi:hypothetical protein